MINPIANVPGWLAPLLAALFLRQLCRLVVDTGEAARPRSGTLSGTLSGTAMGDLGAPVEPSEQGQLPRESRFASHLKLFRSHRHTEAVAHLYPLIARLRRARPVCLPVAPWDGKTMSETGHGNKTLFGVRLGNVSGPAAS